MESTNVFDAATNQVKQLCGMVTMALSHATRDGDYWKIHGNLIDNLAGPLLALGFDFKNVQSLRKEGDKVSKVPPKPGSITELVERVATLQAIVDKRKDPREWDSIQELFHPDMNITDIHAAVVSLLLVYEKSTKPAPATSDSYAAQLKQALGNATEKLWEGRPTQLEQDAQRPPEQEREEIIQTTVAPAPSTSLREAVKCANRRGATAEILWDMLDNIDTLSDQIKPTEELGYRTFYQKTMNIAACRHTVLKSNGHTLMWPDDDDSVERIHGRYKDLSVAVEAASNGYAWHCKFTEHEWLVKGVSEGFRQSHEATRAPVPMLIYCPICHTKHIDEGEFATKRHHTHACQGFLSPKPGQTKLQRCGHVWRPAIVATVGVETLPGFLNAPPQEGVQLIGKRIRVRGGDYDTLATITGYDAFASDDKPYFAKYFKGQARLSRSEFEVLPESEQR